MEIVKLFVHQYLLNIVIMSLWSFQADCDCEPVIMSGELCLPVCGHAGRIVTVSQKPRRADYECETVIMPGGLRYWHVSCPYGCYWDADTTCRERMMVGWDPWLVTMRWGISGYFSCETFVRTAWLISCHLCSLFGFNLIFKVFLLLYSLCHMLILVAIDWFLHSLLALYFYTT